MSNVVNSDERMIGIRRLLRKRDLLDSVLEEYNELVSLYGDGTLMSVPRKVKVMERNIKVLTQDVMLIEHGLGIESGMSVEFA
jgi:hypothetical protein